MKEREREREREREGGRERGRRERERERDHKGKLSEKKGEIRSLGYRERVSYIYRLIDRS